MKGVAYLLQLAGFDDGSVAVFVVGEAKQDVVPDGARHDPGGLRREGDAAAVSNGSLRGDQLSQDHHEQGALEEQAAVVKGLLKNCHSQLISGGPTLPEPVDPATASIWPFSR